MNETTRWPYSPKDAGDKSDGKLMISLSRGRQTGTTAGAAAERVCALMLPMPLKQAACPPPKPRQETCGDSSAAQRSRRRREVSTCRPDQVVVGRHLPLSQTINWIWSFQRKLAEQSLAVALERQAELKEEVLG